jgi:putative pyruvate formate lyase activating enzyme
LAARRLPAARAELGDCHLCAHHCGVDRRRSDAGRCHAGATARIHSAQTEVSDELEFIPTFAIAFSGCDLRCSFCITGAPSWNPRAGVPLQAASLGAQAARALEQGARSVMILGGEPTVHLPSVLELVAHLPNRARLIWKTNAHGSAVARDYLDGLFDVWLADFKFGNDACARRLSRTPDYVTTVQDNLRWARRHSELVVRHLLMPGHVDCCWAPVAAWLARVMPEVKVNLRSGFWPAWQARRHEDLRRPVSIEEARRASAIARGHELRLIQ